MNRYGENTQPQAAAGWQLARLSSPSALFGANGMRMGSDGKLYVVQAFGSQVSAVDTGSGACETISPVGGPIVAPDDIAFDSHDVMYVTEVMNDRVSARTPSGEVRVIADNVPAANGITAHHDRLFMDECRPGGRLFELYPDGREPRVIADNLSLPNALSVGPDGQLYFPQVFDGEIWRCPIEGGAPERFMDGLAAPIAVKFDQNGLLTTPQAASGEITKIDIQSGEKTTVANVRPGIDNLAIADDNRLFISHFVDGGVAEIQADGTERILVPAGLLGPFGITVTSDGTVYAADGLSMISISQDGQVSRPTMLAQEGYPGFIRGIAAGPAGSVYVTNTAGEVLLYNFSSREPQILVSELNELYNLAPTQDGAVVVAEGGEGRLLKVTSDGNVTVLARDLGRPNGVAVADDGSCYVSEPDKGRVSHVSGGTSTLVEGLSSPQGLGLLGDQLLVVDSGSKELIAVSLGTKQQQTIASGLPVGAQPGVTPQLLMGIPGVIQIQGPLTPFSGLAVGGDGSVYIAADGEGSVLTLKRA